MILVTGGAGYIGSHAVLRLLEKGYEVLVVDSLERGYKESLERVQEISGKELEFEEGDLRDEQFVRSIFMNYDINEVMHFAAFKSVGEGEKEPEMYEENNVQAVRNIVDFGGRKMTKVIFSSTAAVYGNPTELPVTEETRENPISVYGKTKLDAEKVFMAGVEEYGYDLVCLRYFNVIGNHESGKLGEDPARCENLIPKVMQNIKLESKMKLFGDKFDTKDGSQERDFIDVMDLVEAHILAMESEDLEEVEVLNLSTGHSTSNLEVFKMIEEVSGKKVEYEVVDPRQGDPEVLYADNKLARQKLNWEPKVSVKEGVAKQWLWAQQNPEGYWG